MNTTNIFIVVTNFLFAFGSLAVTKTKTETKEASTSVTLTKEILDKGQDYRAVLEATKVEKLFRIESDGKETEIDSREVPYKTAIVMVKVPKTFILKGEREPTVKITFSPDSKEPIKTSSGGLLDILSNFDISGRVTASTEKSPDAHTQKYNLDVVITRSADAWPVNNLDAELVRDAHNPHLYSLYVSNTSCESEDKGDYIIEGEVLQERMTRFQFWNPIYKFWAVLNHQGCVENKIVLDGVDSSSERTAGRQINVRYRVYRQNSPHFGEKPSSDLDTNAL